ncbi:hypothetical protein ACFPRL_12475 [Pseudoclavibacter helvolus]
MLGASPPTTRVSRCSSFRPTRSSRSHARAWPPSPDPRSRRGAPASSLPGVSPLRSTRRGRNAGQRSRLSSAVMRARAPCRWCRLRWCAWPQPCTAAIGLRTSPR